MVRVDIGGGYRSKSLPMAAVPRVEENIKLWDDDLKMNILLIVRDVTWRNVPDEDGWIPFLDVEVLQAEEKRRTPMPGP